MDTIRTVFFGRILPPNDPKESFKGKTVLVTGANTGLGFEAAAKFVKLDAQRVILGCRDIKKGQTAKAEIVKRYGGEGRIDVWNLDMDDYESVRRFSEKVNDLESLDVAILNAGVVMREHRTSQYGWEETLQVNVISTTMLALLLLPKLKLAKAERSTSVLTLVGSALYANVDKTKLDGRRKASNVLAAYNEGEQYNGMEQYNVSKLFLMHVFLTLVSLVDPASTNITLVEPGPCYSNLHRDFSNPIIKYVIFPTLSIIFRTAEQGSRTLVSGTHLGPEGHGAYWQHDDIKA